MSEYISVKDYAMLKGISKSAVYKKLSTTLQPYVEVVEGKKMLKIQCLTESELKRYSTNSGKVFNPNSTILEEQLRAKDKQIESLQEQIKELNIAMATKDEHIMKQSTKLTQLIEQSNKLQENNQILIGMVNDTKAIESSTPPPSTERKGFFKRFFK